MFLPGAPTHPPGGYIQPVPTERLVVPAALAGKRLDRILDTLVEARSRSQLQKLVRRGHVRVGGKRVVRSNVHVDGRVEIEIELRGDPPAEPPTLVHEDPAFLVVEKQSGILTHAADRSHGESLARQLEALWGPLPRDLGDERPGIVHRLDRETSGLIVVARTPEAMRALRDAFAAREVEKTYLALVHGLPREAEFEITEPIGPVPGKADRQEIRPPTGAKSAATRISLVESFEHHALLACAPHTGRRHQIRVHLAAHRLPVWGDPLYGTRSTRPLPNHVPAPKRLALHAHRLSFRHPVSGERLAFTSPLPDDLACAVEALRQPDAY